MRQLDNICRSTVASRRPPNGAISFVSSTIGGLQIFDEPRLFDYNLDFGRDPGYFDGESPWRASDHDPVVVDLTLTP